MTTGEIVHAKSVHNLTQATRLLLYGESHILTEQVDKPFISIDILKAKNVVAAMKSAAKNGNRRFSDKRHLPPTSRYARVHCSALDDKFRPVHQRAGHLAYRFCPRESKSIFRYLHWQE